MTSLAWNLKAWRALSLEVKPGREQAEQQAQNSKLLGLAFRTFVNYLLRIPAQVVKTARQKGGQNGPARLSAIVHRPKPYTERELGRPQILPTSSVSANVWALGYSLADSGAKTRRI